MRPVYFGLSALFFALAVLGAVLPLLPTTPFLLLTSWCLVRSSPAWNERLRRSALFGPLLRDWQERHGVRLHVKVSALCMLVLAVATTLVLGDLAPAMEVALVVLAAAGAAVVLRLKTIRDGDRGA